MKNAIATVIGSSVLTTAVIAGTTGDASAALISRNSCSTSDLTTSVACEGAFSGNDSNTSLDGIFDLSGWSEVAKVDMLEGGIGGTDSLLTVGNGTTSGTWSATGLDYSSFEYMIALKGGNEFATYLLEDNTTSGDWFTTALQNRRGNQPALSHLTLYSTAIVTPPTEEVPEPLTILGSAVALGFGAMFKRKVSK